MVSTKYLVSQLFIIENNNKKWAANQCIRMISEGSCDTEDRSNDAEILALHHRNKLYFNVLIMSKLILDIAFRVTVSF